MEFFLLSLVTWRITYMLIEDVGPAEIFERWRAFAARFDRPFGFYYMVTCWYCLSIWIALPISFLTGTWYISWLALAAMTIFLHLLHDKLKTEQN